MLEIITGENIEKLRELAHKDSVNECVEWLIKHYHMVGEGVVKLQDEIKKPEGELSLKTAALDGATAGNEELKEKVEELEKENEKLITDCDWHRNSCASLETENEELKERISELNKKLYGREGNTKPVPIHTKYICFLDTEFRDTTTDSNIGILIDSYKELKKENEEYKKENEILVDDGMGLVKEIEELKARIAELEESEKQSIETMKIMGINCIGDLVKQNEELKDQLRTIRGMDKEEPCEQVERLLNSVETLTTKCYTLDEKNESIQEELLIEKQRSAMLSASFATLEYERTVLEGEVKQANKTIEQLIEALK